MKKRFFIVLLLLLTIHNLSSCSRFINTNSAIPDQTSYNYYSSKLRQRPNNWEKIIENSSFQLNVKRTSEKIESVGYGTYPSILSIFDIGSLEDEFARQHLSLTDSELIEFSNVFMNRTDELHVYINSLIEQETQMRAYSGVYLDDSALDVLIFPESPSYKLESSNNLRIETIGYVPLVFMVDQNNPIIGLSTKEIKAIYSGSIENFKELGGDNIKIEPFQRCSITYASRMVREIMIDSNLILPNKVTNDSFKGGIPPAPEEYQNSKGSIGYALRHAADKLYGDTVKYLNIDDVAPTDENVQNGTYPYYAVIYAVVRADDEEYVGNSFLDWILSEEGQKCVKMAGFVPIATN